MEHFNKLYSFFIICIIINHSNLLAVLSDVLWVCNHNWIEVLQYNCTDVRNIRTCQVPSKANPILQLRVLQVLLLLRGGSRVHIRVDHYV